MSVPHPYQDVKIFGLQKRKGEVGRNRPWIVRWMIDGRHRSRSFRTRSEADRYRGLLQRAVHDGEQFAPSTGEPDGWVLPLAGMGVHEWVRRWLSEEWPEWAPRTRSSMVEALARFVTLTVRPGARTPADLRRYLLTSLRADSQERDSRLEGWLGTNVLTLAQLDKPVLIEVDRRLRLRLDGSGPLASNTATRFRVAAHACVMAAVEVGAIEQDPWPVRSRARARRKANRQLTTAQRIRSLPSPETMTRAIEAIITDHPASGCYHAMTATAYYAGLRPSEVVMLRVGVLQLPTDGWGSLDVVEADIGNGQPGEPKTGPRLVPIPPQLVAILAAWIEQLPDRDPRRLLFRTSEGNRPNQGNWRRAWHRALASVGEQPIRIYDCRHAAATTWLSAGVPLGECARRLGHSVDTLVSNYVGALAGDQRLANERISSVL